MPPEKLAIVVLVQAVPETGGVSAWTLPVAGEG
jgi:hypothetical protein